MRPLAPKRSNNTGLNKKGTIEELKSILLSLPANDFETPNNSLILWENSEDQSFDNLQIADKLA